MIALYAHGQSIDGEVLVGQDNPEGSETLIGTASNDLILGEKGNDILAGGAGDDVLAGGEGFDLYLYTSATDGNDRIEDSDGQGMIVVDGQALAGGIKKAGETEWTSADGKFVYRLEGTDLKVAVNGRELTINEHFQSGQFGIRLTDVSAVA